MTGRLLRRARRLRAIVGDPAAKSPLQIGREVLSLRAGGQTARDYLDRFLYLEVAGPVDDYLSRSEREALYDAKRRSPAWYRVYHDKTLFDDHYRRAEAAGHGPFSLPAYLGQTRTGLLLRPGHDDVRLGSEAETGAALAEMAGRSPTGAVFAKPAIGRKGVGAFRFDADLPPSAVAEIHAEVHKADYFFQEAVRQHAALDRLCPWSLNTLRILTGTLDDGRRPVLSVVLRLGRTGQIVDNAHAGGIIVGVDPQTGRLRREGRTLSSRGGALLFRHPDTDVPFEGAEVPFFAEAVALAQRAHRHLPLLYAGWDVGVTGNGPVLIEGNSEPHLQSAEAANGGFRSTPAVREFLDAHGILRGRGGARVGT